MWKRRLSGMKQSLPYLKHILDEINFSIEQTQNLSFEDYLKDEVLKRATTRSLEIMGEATKNISSDFKKKYKNIEWKDIAGMRDKIIHFYFGIKWNVVWDVIKNKVPELKPKLESIIKELEK
jgi:uncharacterized protein with HEPN domain